MELGLKVENTPFTPICFPNAENISIKKIIKSFQEKSKNIKIAIFTPKKITEEKSAVKKQQFNVDSSGFPDSSDFLLFKLFVAKSMVENHNLDIAVVCTYNFSASCYAIARWLIDEKGFKLSNALKAIKNAFPERDVDYGLYDMLKEKYSYDGDPIYFKVSDLPVSSDEKKIDIEKESDDADDKLESLKLLVSKDYSSALTHSIDQPKSKLLIAPQPQSKSQIVNEKISIKPLIKASSSKISKVAQPNQINQSSSQIQIENTQKQQWPMPNYTDSSLIIQAYDKKTSASQARQPYNGRRQQIQKKQIDSDKSNSFSYQQEPIHFLNSNSYIPQIHHHHHHHHEKTNTSHKEIKYHQPRQNTETLPVSYDYDDPRSSSIAQTNPYDQSAEVVSASYRYDDAKSSSISHTNPYDQNTEVTVASYKYDDARSNSISHTNPYDQNTEVPVAPYKYDDPRSNSIAHANPYDDYYRQENEQSFSKPTTSYPNSDYYSYSMQNPPDPYQTPSYNYQDSYYTDYDQRHPQQPYRDPSIPNYYSYNSRPAHPDPYHYHPQQPEYPSHPPPRRPPPPPPRSSNYDYGYTYDYPRNYHDNYQYQSRYPDTDRYDYIQQDQYHPIPPPPSVNDPRDYHANYRQPSYEEPNYRYPQSNIEAYDLDREPTPQKETPNYHHYEEDPQIPPEPYQIPPKTVQSFEIPPNVRPLPFNPLELHEDQTNEIPPPKDQPFFSSAKQSLSEETSITQPAPQSPVKMEKALLFMSSSSDENDKENDHQSRDNPLPSIDTEFQLFSRIPISRIGIDTSPDEYGEVCKDIASYLSIPSVKIQEIQSLPFTHEEQLTLESFSAMKKCMDKSIYFRPIPAGVRCFLVARGSKYFLISNEMCREVKISLFSEISTNQIQPLTKSLLEGYLIRHKYQEKPFFLITDCFCSNTDLSGFSYKTRLDEATKIFNLQQSKGSENDDFILRVTDIFQIEKFEDITNNYHFDFEVLGFSFFSPNSLRQSKLNQFNFNENGNNNSVNFFINDSICFNRIFWWFKDGCPIVEINISNTMKCVGLARRNSSEELVEAVDFGFAKKSMLRFNKKIVELEYSANLSKWQIKCISSKYLTWYADDVKNIVCGKEVMALDEVNHEINELILSSK